MFCDSSTPAAQIKGRLNGPAGAWNHVPWLLRQSGRRATAGRQQVGDDHDLAGNVGHIEGELRGQFSGIGVVLLGVRIPGEGTFRLGGSYCLLTA